jgi:hypothetical protein
MSGRSLDGKTFDEFPDFDLDRAVIPIGAIILPASRPGFVPIEALAGV